MFHPIHCIILLLSFVFDIKAKQFSNYDALKEEVDNYCDDPENYTSEEYGPINEWDVSKITVMNKVDTYVGLFQDQETCNPNISKWNVSSVTSFSWMFWDAASFNSDLSDWNVAGATDFAGMFYGARSFNPDLSDWNVAGAKNFRDMFEYATSFNADISGWNVAGAKKFLFMFTGATSFNVDISGWNVSAGTNFRYMFFDAESFYQDLTSWGPRATFADEFCTNAVCDRTCANNQSFQLKWNEKKCYWIGLQENRRKRLCEKRYIKQNCPVTCGTCCDDDPKFRFKIERGSKKGCNWINLNKPKRKAYCEKSWISASCPIKCDDCKESVGV